MCGIVQDVGVLWFYFSYHKGFDGCHIMSEKERCRFAQVPLYHCLSNNLGVCLICSKSFQTIRLNAVCCSFMVVFGQIYVLSSNQNCRCLILLSIS